MKLTQAQFLGVAAVVVIAAVSAGVLFLPPQSVTSPIRTSTSSLGPTTTTSNSSSTLTAVITTTSGPRTTSSTSTASQCVTVGEPLYPYARVMPLQDFVNNMQMEYQVTVNATAHTVTIHNPSGGGIGQSAASTITYQVVSC